jgi:hypothetical protein
MTSSQWVLLCAMQIDGLRPNVRVQYERVSGLVSRIITESLIEQHSERVTGNPEVVGVSC